MYSSLSVSRDRGPVVSLWFVVRPYLASFCLLSAVDRLADTEMDEGASQPNWQELAHLRPRCPKDDVKLSNCDSGSVSHTIMSECTGLF